MSLGNEEETSSEYNRTSGNKWNRVLIITVTLNVYCMKQLLSAITVTNKENTASPVYINKPFAFGYAIVLL